MNREGKHEGKSTASLHRDFDGHLVFPVGMAAERCLPYSHGFLLIGVLAKLSSWFRTAQSRTTKGSEQPGLVKDVPAHCRGVEPGDL